MTDNNIQQQPIPTPQEPKPKIKQLPGWPIIILVLVMIAGGTIVPAIGLAIKDMFSSWDISRVGYDLLDYVENNQQFPPAEKWCDVMQKNEDNDYYSLYRYKENEESFPYTLNKHVLELDKVPDDMVVLFSGSPGWNQVGDFELVKNIDRVKVFFGNGRCPTFRKNHIPHLRWRIEDNGVIPEPNIKIPLMVISSLLVIVFLYTVIACRQSLKIIWILALAMGIVSAVAGAWLGAIAEDVFYRLNTLVDPIVPWISGIWCFIIGVAFIAVIGNIYKKYNTKVSMPGYAIVIGAITGIAASSIVHGYLMIAYQEQSFKYMLAGSSFGIIAGLLLGWITSGLIKLYKNNPAIKAETK